VPGVSGDGAGVVIVVAAAVRPADVVEKEQRERRAGRPLGDQAQLLANRVVVVVPVYHDRVRERQLAQCVEARGADQLDTLERLEVGLWRRIDRRYRGARSGGPGDEHAGEVAGERPDLDHRPSARRVQTRKQHLGRLRKRRPPARRVVRIGIRCHQGATGA
jgi:hypothetical protein